MVTYSLFLVVFIVKKQNVVEVLASISSWWRDNNCPGSEVLNSVLFDLLKAKFHHFEVRKRYTHLYCQTSGS